MPALDAVLDRIARGAPGVYTLPPDPVRRLTGERMDVCAFVGVAPRGPCRVPKVDETAQHAADWTMCLPGRARLRSVAVPVERFDEYRALFGGFEGPGLLPYAVASFFEQGGARAYIVRVVHEYGDARNNKGVAHGELAGLAVPLAFAARNEGRWGNALVLALTFLAAPLQAVALTAASLRLARDSALPEGALLRLHLVDGTRHLRWVTGVATAGDMQQPQRYRAATLSAALPGAGGGVFKPEQLVRIEEVAGELAVSDGAGRSECFTALGLSVAHPRWLASVLCQQSTLVWPDAAWAGGRVMPLNPALPSAASRPFDGGADRWADLVHADFFDAGWDPAADDADFAGLHALHRIPDLTQLCVPDLYQPRALPPAGKVFQPSLAGPAFGDCVVLPPAPAQDDLTDALAGLALDPKRPDHLARIVALQQQVAGFAATTAERIALLDVPPGLTPQQILAWRSQFDTGYAAAYHPWLAVAGDDDGRDALVLIPPSAPAAGIIAARELQLGVQAGPANSVARDAVKTAVRVDPQTHAALHQSGVNVFLHDSTGVLLSAARTLSRDADWRQLSVRRLMLMLRRTLARRMQWAVFEPNGPALRRELAQLVTALLRRLYRAGALRGASEAQAFFVRCDDVLNPPWRGDVGELVMQIGVAPAEPLEFIVLRLTRDGDGTLSLEE
ncbi:phage tail sheath subtilisin-like domain-containing protein [Chitiniphilus purpureus]|uniref:Phage tail sheath subtilisin-like domain-containing protein n=1 Tax=Chitiniphilus purpureus TaxID=2981137 RepID=A0ABY6DK02_9NEIS|nr:phage tail sheath C-terminal domain-containing protein [Chitiniphilus sp. CD1]UXY14689.1 phage tail sheath subtilisin-like domain-containing protein [Chitiniphilus sp. CD1]